MDVSRVCCDVYDVSKESAESHGEAEGGLRTAHRMALEAGHTGTAD
jgi:hypothetical protein